MLLSKPKMRAFVDTVSDKAVLIVSRFSAERLAVLHALCTRGFMPMVFDFDEPRSKDVTETVKTLAGLSCFIVSDMTNTRCNPLELQTIVAPALARHAELLSQRARRSRERRAAVNLSGTVAPAQGQGW